MNFFEVDLNGSILLFVKLVFLVPVVDVVEPFASIPEALEEEILELIVVRFLIKLVREDLFQEWEKSLGLRRRFTEHRRSHLVLQVLDSLELGVVELLVVGVVGL